MNFNRMDEPWGFQDENRYDSSETMFGNELDTFVTDARYDRKSGKLVFLNRDGKQLATVNASDLAGTQLVVDKAYYENGLIHIRFTNGDDIEIDVNELIDEQEFGDGLQVASGKVSVLVDNDGADAYLTVGKDGIRLSGVKSDIDAEKDRAQSEEARIEKMVADEASAARAAESALDDKIETMVGEESDRAKNAESGLDAKIDDSVAELKAADDGEKARAEAAEDEIRNVIGAGFSTASTETVSYKLSDLQLQLSKEVSDRISFEANVKSSLEAQIATETLRATGEEQKLQQSIDELKSGKADSQNVYAKDEVYTKEETDTKVAEEIAKVISDAPEDFDTLKEIADYIESDKTNAAKMVSDISGNKDAIESLSGEVASHTGDNDIHVTEADKANWNAKIGTDALNGYATEQWVEGKGYLTEHQSLSEYATEQWVEDKKYLTEHQSLDNYYTKGEITRMMADLFYFMSNVAHTPEDVENAPEGSSLVVGSFDGSAVNALTSDKVYKSVMVIGGENTGDIKVNASDRVFFMDTEVSGGKGESNGRIQIASPVVELSRVTIADGTSAYNVFETSQSTADTAFAVQSFYVNRMDCHGTDLGHNVASVYTVKDNATIKVSDSTFDINPENTNVLRLSNYTNATGVTVTFDNVEWTYENAGSDQFGFAGLVIYQPASTDKALGGDTSAVSTWKVVFKNCKYNGELVTESNFGNRNQVAIAYNVGGGKQVSDLGGLMTVTFE